MTDLKQTVEELLKLEEKATEGPWYEDCIDEKPHEFIGSIASEPLSDSYGVHHIMCHEPKVVNEILKQDDEFGHTVPDNPADWYFFVAARNNLRPILESWLEMEKRVEKLEKDLNASQKDFGILLDTEAKLRRRKT